MALVDSGACCTMITEKVAEVHRLKMAPFTATFTQADGLEGGRIIGKVDLTL